MEAYNNIKLRVKPNLIEIEDLVFLKQNRTINLVVLL